MPLMRIKEIRDMSSEERTRRLGEIKIELTRLKTMIKAGGTVENPARVKELRRAIAKLLTIENEEKLGLVKKPKEKPKEQKKERRRGRKRNESDVRDN
ncbi:50S ribosomal protein L29 [Candidatus Bathyarchaeota archaeon RBG_13_46_16b]|nr:MAG: 50S ribosomal protein L29 [Candidatus Bathyarchaeota archaeon RBG_13_46_16b]